MALDSNLTLEECLAKALPEACRFNVYHLSTPPTSGPAIFAALPGEQPEQTYCESHFLSVSIDREGRQLQVFAIEVLVYTTELLTTLFVSKADSTGYLYLLNLSQETPSPLRIISTTFLRYLIERRKRSDRRLVLSLFARAQNQYLFPGSAENTHKHVLDDRGLIKWWCKVADPLLGEHKIDSKVLAQKQNGEAGEQNKIVSSGFLRVPGCDTYETQSFLPRGERDRSSNEQRWRTSDPLRDLGKSAELPERCLIPRFPDDPKARFSDTLDDEVPDEDLLPSFSQMSESPSKAKNAGRWRSVRSLEQFWDMMQFRQECSSGRLVGFLWATFQQASLCGEIKAIDVEERSQNPTKKALPTPDVSQYQEDVQRPQISLRSSPPPSIPTKTPPVSPSKPSPAPIPVKAEQAAIRAQPEETKCYYWPTSTRGELVLRQKDYKRVGDQLLRLDYADEEVALNSTRKWINDVAERARVSSWGRLVLGTRPAEAKIAVSGSAKANILNAGLIRRKKRSAEGPDGPAIEADQENQGSGINTLSAGLVRKKAKVASHLGRTTKEKPQRNGNVELG